MNNIEKTKCRKTYDLTNRLFKKYCPTIEEIEKSNKIKSLLLWNDFNNICLDGYITTHREYLILCEMVKNINCDENLKSNINKLLIDHRKEWWYINNSGKEFSYGNIQEIA